MTNPFLDKFFTAIEKIKMPTKTTTKKKCCKGNSCKKEEAVRTLAYLKWEQAGCPEGDGSAFWLEAEKELSSEATVETTEAQ
jgi:hypothetical protein